MSDEASSIKSIKLPSPSLRAVVYVHTYCSTYTFKFTLYSVYVFVCMSFFFQSCLLGHLEGTGD